MPSHTNTHRHTCRRCECGTDSTHHSFQCGWAKPHSVVHNSRPSSVRNGRHAQHSNIYILVDVHWNSVRPKHVRWTQRKWRTLPKITERNSGHRSRWSATERPTPESYCTVLYTTPACSRLNPTVLTVRFGRKPKRDLV